MTDLMPVLEERFGLFAWVIPMLVVLGGAALFIFVVVKTYGGYQRRRYGFHMVNNWPGIIVMLSYAAAYAFQWIDYAENATELFLMLLAIGAPGMICYFIVCLRRTKNIAITIINIVIMYVFYIVLGIILALLMGVAVVIVFGIMAAGAGFSSIRDGGKYKVCKICGLSVGSCIHTGGTDYDD